MNIINELDVNVSVIPNGLEKYMAFKINENLDLIARKSMFFLECPVLYFWVILYLNSFYLKLIKT